jgi:hypothetical protein
MKKFMSWNETLIEHSVVCDDVFDQRTQVVAQQVTYGIVLYFSLELLQAANWKLKSLTS